MARIAFGLFALALAAAAGCSDSRGAASDAAGAGGGGTTGGTGGRNGAGATGGGGGSDTAGTGGPAGNGAGPAGGAGSGGTGSGSGGLAQGGTDGGGRAVCDCDSTTSECAAQINGFCEFDACPPTLDATLHGLPDYVSPGAQAFYWECDDGTRQFMTSPGPFGGTEQLVFGADGSLVYASGPIADTGTLMPICGPGFEFPPGATCKFCQTCPTVAGCGGPIGVGGEGGAGGAAGAAGAQEVALDPRGNPYCMVNTSGEVVMPPGAQTQ